MRNPKLRLVTFQLIPKQNGTTISELFEGRKISHLVSDRGLAAQKLTIKIHQYCLTHLLRNVLGLAEHSATTIEEAEKLGQVYDGIQELFHIKHRLDRAEISGSTWRQYSYASWRHIKDTIYCILDSEPTAKVKRFCRRMLKDWERFKAYLRSRDAPMTNNPAEESLRNLVIARKLCFGSRSVYGRDWRASMHSCIESLRRSGSSMLDFLTEVIRSARLGEVCPDVIQLTS